MCLERHPSDLHLQRALDADTAVDTPTPATKKRAPAKKAKAAANGMCSLNKK